MNVPDFVSDIKDLSRRFSAAVANNSQLSLAVWEAVKPWDETSVRLTGGSPGGGRGHADSAAETVSEPSNTCQAQ